MDRRRRAHALVGAFATLVVAGCRARATDEPTPPIVARRHELPRIAPRRPCRGELERASRSARILERSWPIVGSGAAIEVIRTIGADLAAHAPPPAAPWRFLLVDDDRANAFSIGGGRIYVSRGTVVASRSEGELAAIVAHEMAHELAGHWCEPPAPADADQKVGRVRQHRNEEREREADAVSLRLLLDAGYDPHAALAVVRRLEDGQGYAERVAALVGWLGDVPHGGREDSAAFRAVVGGGKASSPRRRSRR